MERDIFVCKEAGHSSYVGPLLHERVQEHKGACLHATQIFPGHEGRGSRLYVSLHLCMRNVHVGNEARTAWGNKSNIGAASPPVGTEAGPVGARFDGPERPDGMTV